MSLLAAASHGNCAPDYWKSHAAINADVSRCLPTCLPMYYMHRKGFAISVPQESRASEALVGG